VRVEQGTHCGLAVPHVARQLQALGVASVPQAYMKKSTESWTDSSGRRLTNQVYARNGSSYLTIDEAHNAVPRLTQRVRRYRRNARRYVDLGLHVSWDTSAVLTRPRN
jgi:hypothetical protein